MSEKPVQDNPFEFEITDRSGIIEKQYIIPDDAIEELVELHPDVLKGKKSTIKRLHRLCKKYPKLPQFKNYLSLAYENSGNYKKAVEITDRLLAQHPDYLLGRINKAEILMDNGQLDKVPDILGEDMHIHQLYPERNTFHIDEILKYYSTAIHYLILTNRMEEAKLRLDYITEIDPYSPETERASFDYMRLTMMNNFERFDREKLKERRVQSRNYNEDSQTDQPPAFTHSEIEALYEYGLDIPEEIIQSILKLPEESLISDLEHVLEDAVYRYEYFYDEAEDEGWDEDLYNFSIHAVLLLAELRSVQSLDKILDLLRQDTDFFEFWYSDLLEDIFSEPVAVLAPDNLEKISNFLKEPDLDAYCRNVGLTALENIAGFYPECRDEVIEIFDELIHFHLNRLDNDRIIDTTLLSFLVWSCINIQAKELLPSIKKLYDHNLIHETMVGSWKDVERDIKGDFIYGIKKPGDIFERYESLNHQPFLGGSQLSGNSDENKDTKAFFPIGQGDDPSNFFSSQPFEHSMEPEINPYKDVGRNDPCPCGSGKKYKKCCL